jgi:hypothetical protein
MKKILFAITFICLGSIVQAQKVFFIYLQSEKQTPFFVKMGDKVHSSTASGYLILSSLKDSVYVFTIGYPGVKAGESKFSVSINNTDHGFLIKNLEDGPGLFNLQTLSVTKPIVSANRNGGSQTVRTDAFTKLLSRATDDASLLLETVKPQTVAFEKPKEIKKEVEVEKIVPPTVETAAVSVKSSIDDTESEKTIIEEIKTEDAAATQKDQTSALIKEKESDQKVSVPIIKETKGINGDPVDSNKQQTAVAEKPIEEKANVKPKEDDRIEEKKDEQQNTPTDIQTAPYKKSVIKRRSESSTTEGFGLVFIDIDNEVKDTIRILIPHQKKRFVEDAEVAKPATPDPVVKEEVITEDNPNSSTDLNNKYTIACTYRASDKEFLKLRKNMASESNDARMILEAKKYFRNKCFTTDQVRSLSALFLTSASKYQFFEAAYTHVLDPSEFASLGLEIKDEYYLKRFKALIGE